VLSLAHYEAPVLITYCSDGGRFCRPGVDDRCTISILLFRNTIWPVEFAVPRRSSVLFGDVLIQRDTGDIERPSTQQCDECVSIVGFMGGYRRLS
jgi:hypothetical protein